jgi:hypothetical protein
VGSIVFLFVINILLYNNVDLILLMLEWRLYLVSFRVVAKILLLMTRSILETTLSIRPKRHGGQQNPDTSTAGGSSKEANHGVTNKPKIPFKRRQRPTRDDRMLNGVNKLIRNIYVEIPKAKEEACEEVTIKNYQSIASYSWKNIEHPTIYVPGLPCVLCARKNSC